MTAELQIRPERLRADVDALAAIDAAAVERRSTICLFDESWHQGVVGLVASRIKEKFHRPTIAFARAGESELRGSGRSIEGVHLRDTLDLVTKAAPTMVKRFGGHAMAAGLTLPAGEYDNFAAAFEEATRSSCDRSIFDRAIATDGPLEAGEFTLALVGACEQHVWGQGFPAPLFAVTPSGRGVVTTSETPQPRSFASACASSIFITPSSSVTRTWSSNAVLSRSEPTTSRSAVTSTC